MVFWLKSKLFDLLYGRYWRYSARDGKWCRWNGTAWEWREVTSDEWHRHT